MVASNAPAQFVRHTGATAGLVVATVTLAVAVLLRVDVGRIAPTDAFAVATLLTGLIAGALMSGTAWRARRPRAWLWVVVGLAVLAIVIGSLTVSAIAFVISIGNSSQPILLAFPAFLSYGLAAAILGVMLVGPAALPFTFLASLAWAWCVRRWRGHECG